MVLVEMRESIYNKAFELVEEGIKGAKKSKHALCDLYDILAELADGEKEELGEEEYEEEFGDGDNNFADIDTVDIGEINYRGRSRRGMRHNSGAYMRRRSGMRGVAHMRRNRLGRYSY